MAQVYNKTQAILDTASGTFTIDAPCDHFRVQVFGAGSGSVQPYINGSSDFEAYTISDTARTLYISGVEKFVITASGGAITAQVFGFRG